MSEYRKIQPFDWILLNGYPNFLGGSNLGGNLGDNNEK